MTTSPTSTTPGGVSPSTGAGPSVALAALVSAGASYAVLVLAAHHLSIVGNADFLVFWSALFLAFGVLIGLQAQSTRVAYDEPGQSPDLVGPRLIVVALGIGMAAAATVAALSPIWARPLLGASSGWKTAVLCVGIIVFSGHACMTGILAGRAQWRSYSVLISVEGLTRLVLVVVATQLFPSVRSLVAAAALASGIWLFASAVSSRLRATWSVRVVLPLSPLLRRIGSTCAAAAASAVMIVGFPILMRLVVGAEDMRLSAPIILAISLTRAPLLIPLGAFQSVAISHFLKHRDRGLHALLPIIRAIAVMSVIGAAAAWFIGPPVLRTINSGYVVPGTTFAGLTVGAGFIAILTITGSLLVALDLHRGFAIGWLVATCVAAGFLAIPTSLDLRVVMSLLLGPLAGIAVHVSAVRTEFRLT